MDIAPGTIVVGTDGSPSAAAAVRWAATRAAAEHRRLTLLVALHPATPTWLDPDADTASQAREESLRTRGHQVLAQARADVDRAFPDLVVTEVCCLADPREALVEASGDAHVLVVGSRGRGHLRSLLLGSTSVAVVRHARCPVVVHRPTTTSPARRGVAVGADASEDSLAVLEFAYREADLHGVPLTVVHSVGYDERLAPYGDGDTTLATPEEQQLGLAGSMAGKQEKYPDVEAHTILSQRMPEQCLLDLADQVDLLVVGVHHQSRAAQFMFGSVSVWLVEHATCPVAVVPIGAS